MKHVFGHVLITTHPADIVGELAGKGSNATWAAEEVRTKVLDIRGITLRPYARFHLRHRHGALSRLLQLSGVALPDLPAAAQEFVPAGANFQ
jgi:hypothetical protein